MSALLAPELNENLSWLNADAQSLAGQRGRVLALVFWNASSVYCLNLIGELARINAKHPLGLSVIGIHVPKFDAELDDQTVLKAINRQKINFPVANDRAWVAWQHFGITRWPSVALIDSKGLIREIIAGDDQLEVLEKVINDLIQETPGHHTMRELGFRANNTEEHNALSFPSGIAVTDTHLYVADTGHHRILECTHQGRILREFGNGHPDLNDGPAGEAAFHAPRGLCLVRETLYVADTGNHALRRINLIAGDVATVLGTGKAGQPRDCVSKHSSDNALNMPWGLCGSNDKLYIAMAGCNQIWEYELGTARLRFIAGTGELGIADGLGRNALFAQPAGVALVQQSLYVVDSASSAVRAIQLQQNAVQTLVGQGLYEFGHQDGERREARLQFPQAVALDPNAPVLWIADTYNGSLRKLRLGGGGMSTQALPQNLNQPVALAAGSGALWIADAAAHEVLRYDFSSELLTRLPIGE
jgi:Redoxin/NHL repeat